MSPPQKKSGMSSTREERKKPRSGQEPSSPSLVVGIGASAGGLAAFNAFFANMPTDCGMAFILVQHLAPDHDSALAELLARQTSMPVVEAEDGVRLAADHVYVIPPNATLTVADGALRVERPAPPREHRRPIDTFFAALGEQHDERSVGIVLSGVGSDGSRGLGTIKEHGGLTIAQAEFDSHAKSGMPSSAAATGLVDFVVKVEEMPGKLTEYVAHLDSMAGRKNADGVRADVAENLVAVTSLLRERTNHDFSGYKEKTLVRRVQRRMQVLQIETVDDYVRQLRERPEESDLLFRDLDIGVTRFFRDPAAFDALKATVLSPLVAGRDSREPIRIWVPGCATGEEVYSIAILLREIMTHRHSFPPATIFGTDIDARAIATARAARFGKAAESVSSERLERWFRKDGDDYCPIPPIREMCVFSPHSAIKDPPFSRLDLVSCRNLLIYLDGELQNRLMRTFHYALRPGGHVFLGTSESVTRESRLFSVIDRENRILRRRDGVRMGPPGFAAGDVDNWPAPRQRPARAADVIAKIADRLLAAYSPVALVVDRNHEILRFLGGEAGPYLDPSPGAASLHVFGILHRELRAPVRAAFQSATESGRAVNQDLTVSSGGRQRQVNMIVEPILDGDVEKGLCLIVFREHPEAARTDDGASRAADIPVQDELRAAKMQLQAARDELESHVEEMKASNEEYQSVNEELQSTNEELETSKEEMQSVNEELQTINNELNVKNEALAHLNSDLQNLLDNTQIATIFLDESLRIRSFTPASTNLFPLREADRGRSITEIVNLLSYDELLDDVRQVLRDLTVVERQLNLKDKSATYLMRIRPYRTVKNVIDGIVLTFVDMTENKQHQDQMQLVMDELSHRTNNLLAVILAMCQQSIRHSTSLAEFHDSFEARIMSLANANKILVQENWEGGSLGELVRTQLFPFVDANPDLVEVNAPDLLLTPAAVQALGLAFHELGTNAVKHGAFSAPGGRIAVRAELSEGDPASQRLKLEWRELGGPPVGTVERKGFGHVVLERMVPQQLDAVSRLEFAPDGVRWTLDAPAARVLQRPRG